MADWLIAFALSVLWGVTLVRTYLGISTVRDLPSGLDLPDRRPLVSVIIAAKEEQENIQETIRHLMKQTYERIEIIAVNDRSNDATGAKMEALKAWSEGKPNHVTLKIIHITHLPPGWLGKNHAMYQGYLQSKGTYLLFTDADVRFEPDTILDTVAYAHEHKADHITLLPKLIAHSFWLKAFVHYFLFSICLFVPPWTGNNDQQHRRGIGVGAFNFIRRDAYEQLGTHRALSMRPDDDLRLGMLVKMRGFKQRVLAGAKRIEVEWYPTLGAAVRGLEKNLYSGFGYRLPLAILGVAMQLFLIVFPLIAPLWSRGPALGIYVLADLFLVASYLMYIRRFNDEEGWDALVLPVSAFLLSLTCIRSVTLAHVRKGVFWRGTFYPLDELRRLFQ
jgi:glycosyltransferase involved in cell wall biosynthesis